MTKKYAARAMQKVYNKSSTKEGSHSEMPVGETMSTYNWTSRDLETMPDNGKLYEVIAGELYVSKQPHLNHQIVCSNINGMLKEWVKFFFPLCAIIGTMLILK